MCGTCGCSADDAARPTEASSHEHRDTPSRAVRVEAELLGKNDGLARENRAWMAGRGATAFNIMGGPGAGKTALLEATIGALAKRATVPVAVIEGDQATARDRDRIQRAGCPAVQVNTGAGCHLEADMVADALRELNPPANSLLFIENVGNLVCPALFDLGERARVVVMSVTEGADKPLKYPHMFRDAEVLVVNKIDLLPHVEFDLDGCVRDARQVNPRLRVFALSATRGDGISAWLEWLDAEHEVARARPKAGEHGTQRHQHT